jgi:hypothetical protein
MQRICGRPAWTGITISAATIPARAGLSSGLRSGLEVLSKALLDHHQTAPGRFQQMQQSTAARQPETAGQALATGGIASRYPANAGRPSEPGVPDQSGEADVTRIGNVPRWEGEGSRTQLTKGQQQHFQPSMGINWQGKGVQIPLWVNWMMGRSRCPVLDWVSGDSWCRSRHGECAEHGHVLGKSAQAQVIG